MSEAPSAAHWRAQAAALAIDTRPFIGGVRVQPLDDAVFDVVNPQDGRVLAAVPACGRADVDAAVSVARAAFEARSWHGLSPWERGRILLRLADRIEQHGQELALLDVLQMGMPITQALADIPVAVEGVRATAELADKLPGEVVPGAPGGLALNLRVPHGVVAAVTPWNFPLFVALAKVVPALAAGNTVVLKPSEIAPLACLRLADLAAEAGLPPGVLNVVPGLGPQAGRALALHTDVDCLAFTGSTATGLQLLQYAGQSNMKRLLLECGGKSPQLVFDDLGDIHALADSLVQGFVWNGGQVCTTGSRILVARDLCDRLLPLLAQRVDACRTGDPLDPATLLGPLASLAQAERVRRAIVDGSSSARRLAQGMAAAGDCHVAPVLFADARAASPLMQEEIFGPVAGVMAFDTPEQVLAQANDSRYGLSATLWTRDVALAHRLVRSLKAGTTLVNSVAVPQASQAFWGGAEPAGLSGQGAEGGAAGVLAYTRLRSVGFQFG